jgi:dihydrofolate reductase
VSAAISLVVGVAENGVMGAEGGLPWRVRADLRRFRTVTMGKPLVMGRKTFESIGKPLDGRDNIVVTRRPDFSAEGILVAGDIDAALAIAERRAKARGADEICVIGGGEIFAAVLDRADRVHLTHVAAAPAGDVFFPRLDPAEWIEISREPLPHSDGDTAAATYTVYGRRR